MDAGSMDAGSVGSPQQGTSVSASPAAGAERHRPLAGAATVATVLLLLVLVREVLVAVANWREYSVVHDYLAGRMTQADLQDAVHDIATLESWLGFWPAFLVWAAAGVAVLVWLWRARVNAELMRGADAHRRSRGWVVGAWMSPVVNLWYPHQVVSDIWQASAPRRPAPVALVHAWWAAFLAAGFVRPIQWRMASNENTEKDVLAAANVSILLAVLVLASGVLLILVIKRVTAWQTQQIQQIQAA